jgi:hypothetical protein
MLVAEPGGLTMFARIGIKRALTATSSARSMRTGRSIIGAAGSWRGIDDKCPCDSAAGTNLVAPALNSGGVELRGVMNNPDEDTLVRGVEDARRILGEYIEPGRPRDAARTVERLLAVLDRNDVIHALDRIKRRRVIRLVE